MMKGLELLAFLGLLTVINGQKNFVGFTFAHSTSEITYNAGQTIQFPTAVANYNANFDGDRFICETAGYYFFALSIDEYDRSSERQAASIMIGTTRLATANSWSHEDRATSVQAIIYCPQNEVVKVVAEMDNGRIRSYHNSVLFTGYLVQIG